MSTLVRELAKRADFYLATYEHVNTDGARRSETGVTEKGLDNAHKLFQSFTALDGVSNVVYPLSILS